MQVRFAQTLSQLRHEKGVSQRQAAQALEVSQALLSHYEGAPEGVDPAVLRSAAEVLTQLCLELCRRHPESQALFHCLAGELAQEMPAEKKPTTREKKPKAVKA